MALFKEKEAPVQATLHSRHMEVQESYKAKDGLGQYGIISLWSKEHCGAPKGQYKATISSRGKSNIAFDYHMDSVVSADYDKSGALTKIRITVGKLGVIDFAGKVEIHDTINDPSWDGKKVAELVESAWEKAKSLEPDVKKLREDPAVKKALEKVS